MAAKKTAPPTPPAPAKGKGKQPPGGQPPEKGAAAPAAPAAPGPKPAKLSPRPKQPKLRPGRTLVPVPPMGRDAKKAPREPGEERVQQWGARGAPGVDALIGWDVEGVAGALRRQANGDSTQAGLMLDDLKIHPIVFNCIQARQEAWRTLPKVIQPGRGDGAVRFADFWREVMPDILSDDVLDDWWVHTEFMGKSVSGMDWEVRTDGRDRWWLPVVKPWHPSNITHRFIPVPEDRSVDGMATIANTRSLGPVIVEPGMGRWVEIAKGALAPWMNGLIRALGEPWLGDIYTLRDNMALQERFGQGIIKMFHPVEWNSEQIESSIFSVRSSGRGGVVSCPMDREGKRRVDLETLKADAVGAQIFDLSERRLLRRFLITLLGQDMTTVGQTGGFAQAAIHNQVLWHKRERDAARFGDARLFCDYDENGRARRRWVPYTGPIRQQIVRWIAYFNTGSFAMAPYTFWDATPPEDTLERGKAEAAMALQRAQALAALMKAVPTLQQLFPTVDAQFIVEQVAGIVLTRPDADGTDLARLAERLSPAERMSLLALLQEV